MYSRLSIKSFLNGRHGLGAATARQSTFSTIPKCPAATCACRETPEYPNGLEIDRSSPLNGLISGYAEQVIICTGRDDWPSRIEDGDGWLTKELKRQLGRGGRYSDPFYNVSILNSSFPSEKDPSTSSSAFLFPSFKYVSRINNAASASASTLIEKYLTPQATSSQPSDSGGGPPKSLAQTSARDEVASQPVDDVMVLICGHGGRDARCGVIGPVLRSEFEEKLADAGLDVRTGPLGVAESKRAEDSTSVEAGATAATGTTSWSARVGLISHIGGHKFAGNVIIYLPPSLTLASGEKHPLAGHGIWYGRVEPRHVEGIVKETIREGRVIQDMFRGGIDTQRRILRL